MHKKALYQLTDVSFNYQLGSHLIWAIKNLTLEIPAQKLVTLTGPSGSGKSSLLHLLGLIEPVQQGEVLFQGLDLKTMDQSQQNLVRKFQIGFIFQQFHLIPVFTAEENVAFFLARQGLGKAEITQRVEESLQAVKIWEHRKKKPGELSGGQRQRVAIARALAKKPDVIIGDEPTASLDQENGKEIMQILKAMTSHHQVSVVLATHDPMVQSYAEKSFHLVDGHLKT
mgnify:CR=1 FL=1